MYAPEGPSTQYLRTLVPNTTKGMVLEAETSNIGYLDPLGSQERPLKGCLMPSRAGNRQKPSLTPGKRLALGIHGGYSK